MCSSRIMETNLVFEGPTRRNHHPKSHFARSIAGGDHGGRQKVRSWLRGFCGCDRGANETKFNLRSELERQGHQVRESRPEQGQRSRIRSGGETATRVRSFGLYDDLNYQVREIPRQREFSCDLFLKLAPVKSIAPVHAELVRFGVHPQRQFLHGRHKPPKGEPWDDQNDQAGDEVETLSPVSPSIQRRMLGIISISPLTDTGQNVTRCLDVRSGLHKISDI